MGLANLSLAADLAARQCVMASMLYYGLDINIIPDAEYDRLSKLVASHWDKLTPMRQWMVGKREEIAASGFQCKVTVQAANAAVTWVLSRNIPLYGRVFITRPWRNDRRQGLRFLHTNEFTLRSE